MHSMAFIHRTVIRTISGFLSDHGLVLVEGPPRGGKSTMARQLAASASAGAVLVDARLREGRAIIDAPGNQSAARPIILDNAERADARRLLSWARAANAAASGHGSLRLPRFVLVGRELGRAVLAGADDDGIAWTGLGPLSLFEAGQASLKRLWLRGGYPEAFTAATDDDASAWLETHAADLVGGELAAWGMPREPRLIRGLLEALAAADGRAFNENATARALGVSRPTIARYLGVLVRAGIVFQVPALPVWLPGDIGSGAGRVIRSAALYLRDSGLLHALVGIRSAGELAQNPRLASASWAGFVIGQTLEALPAGLSLYRYASADGAALDLVLARGYRPVLLAAARRHRPASVERSLSYAAAALDGHAGSDAASARCPGRYIVVPDGDERQLPGGFSVLGLGAFLERVAMADA